MTLLLVGAGYFGGVLTAAAIPLLLAWMARRRAPVQIFRGRVFPHPLDELWALDGGTVATHGKIRVSRYDIGSLWIGDVRIASGKRAVRYYLAIEAAVHSRVMTRALESIP